MKRLLRSDVVKAVKVAIMRVIFKLSYPVEIGKKRRKSGFRRMAGLEGLAELCQGVMMSWWVRFGRGGAISCLDGGQ